MMTAKYFAWVTGNHIRHAGRIIGFNGPMRLLSGAGLATYQYVAKWCPVEQLRPLEEVAHLPRALESLTLQEQRKRKKRHEHH